jgi:hypothetical protein
MTDREGDFAVFAQAVMLLLSVLRRRTASTLGFDVGTRRFQKENGRLRQSSSSGFIVAINTKISLDGYVVSREQNRMASLRNLNGMSILAQMI